MTKHLISFDDGWMNFPDEELPDVAKAAQAVVEEARAAGVWVFGGGLESQQASIVSTDGMVTDGPYPETKEVIGGFAVVDVPSRDEALVWAAKWPPAAVLKRSGARARPDRLIGDVRLGRSQGRANDQTGATDGSSWVSPSAASAGSKTAS